MAKPSEINIRRATEADIPALARLGKEYDGDESWLRDRITATWPNWTVFVAENGSIVGLVAAVKDADLDGKPVFNLIHLYVSPGHRHIETARALVESVTRLGRTLWTMVPASREQVRLARRFGFSEIGTVMGR
jgi:N-acetylglutamate synthase-like GNAT family acetyltransferase